MKPPMVFERNELHITVGTHPTGGIDLTQELRVLKAAMLYADKVTFCSATASFLLQVTQLGELPLKDILSMFSDVRFDERRKVLLAQSLSSIDLLEKLEKKKFRSTEELRRIHFLKNKLSEAQNAILPIFEDIQSKSGIPQLKVALSSGVVELPQFVGTTVQEITKQFFSQITDAVSEGQTYPLFDDKTGQLVDAATREGVIQLTEPVIKRARQVGLSSDLFSRLPLFDTATFDEIIDIRKELDRALIRFRSGIITFSKTIESLPWTESFSQEVEQIFRETVHPGIIEIEDAIKSNNLLIQLVPEVTPAVAAAPVLGLALATAFQLPEIIAGAIGAAALTAKAVKDWRERRDMTQAKSLYFYYRLRDKLKAKR